MSGRDTNEVSPEQPFQFAKALFEIALLAAIEGPFGLGALAGLIGAMGGFIAGPQPEEFDTSAEGLGRAGVCRHTSEDGCNQDRAGQERPNEASWT